MSNEEPVSPQPEKPLAQQMGDPAGPPQTVEAKDPVLGAIAGIGITLVVAGGLLLPALATSRATCGATRSAKVRWEERQQQVDKAIAEQESQAHE
jgi:hypothetical protein